MMMAEIRIGIAIGTGTEGLCRTGTTWIRSGDAVQAEKGLPRQPEMEQRAERLMHLTLTLLKLMLKEPN